MRENLLCSVIAFGYITELHQDGPIMPPRSMPAGPIYRLVRNGYKVFEHNPMDLNDKIQLTIDNFNDESKFEKSNKNSIVETSAVDVPKISVPTVETHRVNNPVITLINPPDPIMDETSSSGETVKNTEIPATANEEVLLSVEEISKLSNKKRRQYLHQHPEMVAAISTNGTETNNNASSDSESSESTMETSTSSEK